MSEAHIALTMGKFAILDEEDLALVSSYKWHATTSSKHSNWYARTNIVVGGRRTTERMHRLIIGDIPAGLVVDHVNGDGLDNRRANLRLATKSQNSANSDSLGKRSKTGYRGVYYYKNGRFQAQISGGKRRQKVHIGYFGSSVEAALAYDAAARQRFGEFARLNFSVGAPRP